MNTKRDRLYELLYDAQAELFNAIERLETYVRETNDLEAEAYIVDHLKIIAHRDHGFLAGDLNLDDLMERLDDEEEEDATDTDDKAADEQAIHIRTPAGIDLYYSPGLGRYVTIPTDEE